MEGVSQVLPEWSIVTKKEDFITITRIFVVLCSVYWTVLAIDCWWSWEALLVISRSTVGDSEKLLCHGVDWPAVVAPWCGLANRWLGEPWVSGVFRRYREVITNRKCVRQVLVYLFFLELSYLIHSSFPFLCFGHFIWLAPYVCECLHSVSILSEFYYWFS